jgi:hypothetical protein
VPAWLSGFLEVPVCPPTSLSPPPPLQIVSTILSDNNDATYLYAHHKEAQDVFTWKIGGVEITYKSIQKLVATYFTAIFVAFILPGINSTIDEAKKQALRTLNETRAEIGGLTKFG